MPPGDGFFYDWPLTEPTVLGAVCIPLVDHLMIFATYGFWWVLAKLGSRSKLMRAEGPLAAGTGD